MINLRKSLSSIIMSFTFEHQTYSKEQIILEKTVDLVEQSLTIFQNSHILSDSQPLRKKETSAQKG